MKNILKFFVASLSFVYLACSSDDKDTAGGVVIDQGVIAIENKTVAGVSQKGPFVKGTLVDLYGLSSNYVQSGSEIFTGKIINDKGIFTISKINLSAQYALLKTSGYYRNEVTGKISSGTLDLLAITDLSKRDQVNVNLLTHLEYERVMALLDSSKTLAKAKAQAESEIFKAFYVSTDAVDFEDLNIFETGDADAALLAVSVMLQGNRGEGDLVEVLTKFSLDLERDGAWNDEGLKANIADWASDADLKQIRTNIESWNFADSVPEFEKYVKNFWWQVFGLGVCNAAVEDSVRKNTNSRSIYFENDYKCNEKEWVPYKADEKNLDVWPYEQEKSSSSETFVISSSSKELDSSASEVIDVASSSSENDATSSSSIDNILFEAWSYIKGPVFMTDRMTNTVLARDVGQWMAWTDYWDGGKTYVNMGLDDSKPVYKSMGMVFMPQVILDNCKGICGTVHYGEKGSLAGGRASWAVQKVILVQTPEGEDVTEWGGFCVEYESEIPLRIALLTGHEDDGADIFIHHILRPSKERKIVNLKWSDFENAKTDDEISVEEYVKKFMAVYVFEQADLGGEGFFNLTKLGVYGTCN